VSDLLAFLTPVEVILGIIASLIGIGSFLIAAKRKRLWPRFREWLYKHIFWHIYRHSARYQIAQLREEHQQAIAKLTKKLELTRELVMKTWDDLTAYMQAAKYQHEELNDRTLELQECMVDVEATMADDLAGKPFNRKSPAERIKQRAKDARERNGVSNFPPLPGNS